MATKEEKQELLEILKFTPRTYKISMWGYGGEKVVGTVKPEVWNYLKSKNIDLQDIAWDYDAIEEMSLDEDLLPFPPGSWYECDGISHVSGVSMSAGTIQIDDENGNTVFEKSLSDCDGCDGSPGLSCNDEFWIGSRSKGEVIFIGCSNEKGTFFDGEIELKAPFDIEKLEIHYDDIDGEEIVSSVFYNGEEIDGSGGYSTTGKSSDMILVRVIDDEGNWERYEVSEDEIETENPTDFPESACTSEVNESWNPAEELDNIWEDSKTNWFDISVNPERKGSYECEFESTTWPFPIERMCEWSGRSWKENGKKAAGIKRWRGLKFDPKKV